MVSLTGASGVSVPPTGVSGGLGPSHFSRNGVCPQKQLLASEAGMSEECEGSTLTDGMRPWITACVPGASCWAGAHVCISPKSCVGYMGSLTSPPQDPMSEGPVGSVEGHRVWAGVAAGQGPVPCLVLQGQVKVQVLVNPNQCLCAYVTFRKLHKIAEIFITGVKNKIPPSLFF